MVDFPPYIRLVPNSPVRRGNSAERSPERVSSVAGASGGAGSLPTDVYLRRTEETYSLVSRENRLASQSEIPTSEQAQQALERLRQDLPALGRGVDRLHSKLDSRRILDLLAPLV